jgi:hypothetical protein
MPAGYCPVAPLVAACLAGVTPAARSALLTISSMSGSVVVRIDAVDPPCPFAAPESLVDRRSPVLRACGHASNSVSR